MGGEAATLGCCRKGFLDCSNHPEIKKNEVLVVFH